MGILKKVRFPYPIPLSVIDQLPRAERIIVFFGTSFLGAALPPGWNEKLFAERTGKMLAYIQQHFPGRKLIYQPHPNETEETTRFDLGAFVIGDKMTAEIFLYDNCQRIEYVFSACSGASASALSMGFNSAIFLDWLEGVATKWDILAYRSYFAGAPESFFIKSFSQSVPPKSLTPKQATSDLFLDLKRIITGSSSIWILASEPGVMVKAKILTEYLHQFFPTSKIILLKMNNRRWEMVNSRRDLLNGFDQVVTLKYPSVRYSARPGRVLGAIRSAQYLKRLPIKDGDSIITFPHTLFEENCLISYFPQAKKVLLIDNRWFDFTNGEGSRSFKKELFFRSKGVLFFNLILEPLLGLHRTIFLEYPQCSVLNKLGYTEPIDQVYDATFVLMP